VARKTSFYYSFLSLEPPKRRAILAVFDFCRAVDDSVDLERDPERARAALAAWRRDVDALYSGAMPVTVEARQLQPVVESFRLSRANLDALVDGVEMDAQPRRFETFGDLEGYCHRVASAVGLTCVEVFGCTEPGVTDYARDLGVALQLTNILRDVAVDLERDRLYLPLEDLARFDCGEEDIRREVDRGGPGIANARVRAVLGDHAARARSYYDRATRALPAPEARNLLAAEIMRRVYRDLLRRIEEADYDVFSRVVRVPRPLQALIAVDTWWKARRATRS